MKTRRLRLKNTTIVEKNILDLTLSSMVYLVLLLSGTGANAQNVYIPDPNFKAKLLNHSPVIDVNNDGEIQVSEAESFSGTLMVSNQNISDLTGIEAFTALLGLQCFNNQLTHLDVTNNTALVLLYCMNNELTNLDVTNNTALTVLWCYSNELTSLDIANNTPLTDLRCQNNQLTNLDLSNFSSLANLSCWNNQLINLDVSNCTELPGLGCYNNQLTHLDVTNCTALTYLNCSNNQLTYLDASSCTALESLICNNNQLTNLDVTNCPALESLNCSSNQLTGLDVTNNIALTNLNCSSNQLTGLDVTNNIALTTLTCGGNQLTDLDVTNNIALTILTCTSNQLTNLDVANNVVLEALTCFNNKLTDLDVTNNIALAALTCGSNQLTGLDVTNNITLTYLYCNDNQLLSLNVANGNNTNFTRLYATNNPDLTCIQVDDSTYSANNWVGIFFQKDSTASWSENCGNITLPVPVPPTLLTVTPFLSPLSVMLNWTDNATDETGYKIERSTDGIEFAEIADVPANTISYTDNTVNYSTTYHYRVYAYNANGNSDFSNVAQVTMGTLSIADTDASVFSVYPNPVNSRINIELKENTIVHLVTLLGETVAIHQLSTGNNSIDVSNLMPGVYFLQTENGTAVKFICE